jgi:hypothetical protein
MFREQRDKLRQGELKKTYEGNRILGESSIKKRTEIFDNGMKWN